MPSTRYSVFGRVSLLVPSLAGVQQNEARTLPPVKTATSEQGDCRICRGAGVTPCQPCRGKGGRVICSYCNGNGHDPFKNYTRCTFCNGAGKMDCCCMSPVAGVVPGQQICVCAMTETQKKQHEEREAMANELTRGMTDMGLGMFKNAGAMFGAGSGNAVERTKMNRGLPGAGSGFGGGLQF